MPSKISFIICSWQAPSSLDETLDSISRQLTTDDAEIVLVNNGFTSARASELQRKYPVLRLVDEPIPGLAHARRAGFRAARGVFFVCLDDDNLIGDDFINSLHSLVIHHQQLGCICPLVVPLWEKEPELWLQEFGKCCLSYNSVHLPARGALRQESIWKGGRLQGWPAPPGGGMIIHRLIAEDYLREQDKKRLKLGRIGGELGGSEDSDIISRVNNLGLGAAWSENLVVFHQIPEARTKLKYLLRLNFRMTQDAAMFEKICQRKKEASASNSLSTHRALLFWRLAAWMRGKIGFRLLLLEWARSLGFIWGWAKETLHR
ncbi:MAG: glycosyltransferase [Verrucomicrobiota bacterium]